MGNQYILKKGIASLNDLIDGHSAVMATANDLYHVDHYHENASDSNAGDDPKKPMLTIAGAYGRCAEDRGDVIFIKGDYRYRENELVVEKSGVKFIGAGWATQWNRTSSQVGDYVLKVHGASDVGLYNLQLSGTDLTEDVIYWGEGTTGDSPAHGVIQNCLIRCAWYVASPAGASIGLKLVSPTFMKVNKNLFYACGTGIDIADGSEKTAHALEIEDNKLMCGSYGIKWVGYGYTSFIHGNKIADWLSTVNLTYGIYLNLNSGGVFVTGNYLGAANPFYDANDLNYWVGNFVTKTEAASEDVSVYEKAHDT